MSNLSYAEQVEAKIHQDYSYPKNPDKKEQFAAIREDFKQIALRMSLALPQSPDTDMCLLKIKEAAMWASSSVAIRPA